MRDWLVFFHLCFCSFGVETFLFCGVCFLQAESLLEELAGSLLGCKGFFFKVAFAGFVLSLVALCWFGKINKKEVERRRIYRK